jgi:hypothetical protein
MNAANPATSLRRLTTSLIGERVWWVAPGVGASFSLALGGGFPRKRPVKSANRRFSAYQPEISLIVWCVWRLETSRAPLASSDGDDQRSIRAVGRALIGKRIRTIELVRPCWDLRLDFTGGVSLKIFCDHIPGDPSFDGNWQVRVGPRIAAVGPGAPVRFSMADHIGSPAVPFTRRSRRPVR